MVKSTGIIRKIDSLGRLVLPIETRMLLKVCKDDDIEILTDKEKRQIILQKAYDKCLKCGKADNLNKICDGNYICDNCLKELKWNDGQYLEND